MALMMTIDVAELSPPRNTSSASPSAPCDKGRCRTYRSGEASGGSISRPITAMGSTNSDIAIR